MGKSLLIFITGFLSIAVLQVQNISKSGKAAQINLYTDYEKVMVKNIANSGIELALAKISENADWRAGFANLTIADGIVNVTVIDRGDIDDDVLDITSVATFNGRIDSSKTRFYAHSKNLSFSRFAYLSNTEPTIWFTTNDTLEGPVHTNGRFHMTGTPVFNGYVSSVSSGYSKLGYTNPQFNAGSKFGAPLVKIPNDMNDLKDAAFDEGHYVSGGDLYLHFNGDGTYNYRIGSSGPWIRKSISSANGAIYCQRNVYVEGIVDGTVTIGGSKDIYITDDITYKDDPRTNPDSDDMMGLISKRNVYVQYNAQNRMGCTIHASVFTMDGSFQAENIVFSPPARLEILGGVCQRTRGAVGRLNPPRGYKKYYQYDDRLSYMSPPFFPVAIGSVINATMRTDIQFIYWID